MLTEQMLTEDDVQWTKLTLEALVPHIPEIFKIVSVSVVGGGGAELYVVPLFHAHLDITDEINVPANVPANAARLTMDDIRAAPKQRQAKRA